MVWFAFAAGLNRRRETRRLRAEAMASVAAPEALHPLLGLGGRSIELSLSLNGSYDPAAFELAVDELDRQVLSEAAPRSELLADATWLAALPAAASMPSASVSRLARDLAVLGG